MRKINPLLVFGGLSALLFIFRVIQLFLINEGGVVDPWWMSVPVYLILAATALISFVFVKNNTSEETPKNYFNLASEIIMLIFSFVLACEGSTSIVNHLAWDAITVAAVSAINAFVFFAASFLLHRLKLEKFAEVAAFLGFIEIIVYLVATAIEIFIANGTSLSFILNLLSLIGFISQLFFFKSLAREYTQLGTEKSRISLKRSAYLLLCILPAEIVGQVLCRSGLLSDFPKLPFRSGFVDIVASACLLVLVGCVLTAKEKNREEPSQEVNEE